MYGPNIDIIDLKSSDRQEVEKFLSVFDLSLDKNVDVTYVIRAKDRIVGTCSTEGKVLKCFAVTAELQGQGLGAQLMTYVINNLFDRGILGYFLFTLPQNKAMFTELGFREIYTVDKASLLEGGTADISRAVREMVVSRELAGGTQCAALVMNCNPLTLGHRYLIAKAASENEHVVVFIVQEDLSFFPFKDRIDLVKKNTSDLKNVAVMPAGDYIISSATFPTYFLKEKSEILKTYTSLDAGIFGKYIAPAFGIKKRYVGTEPTDEVTKAYNAALATVLPRYGIELVTVDRIKKGHNAISASSVRRLLHAGAWENIRDIVPNVTYEYLWKRWGENIEETEK
jgi:[citrate (pro-3S)-lyase] ligase